MNKEKYLLLFGRRVKTARDELRLTQEELAKMVDVPKSALSAYENGKTDPRLSLLAPLASALRVSITWLATGENGTDTGVDETKAQMIKDYIDFLEHKSRRNQ